MPGELLQCFFDHDLFIGPPVFGRTEEAQGQHDSVFLDLGVNSRVQVFIFYIIFAVSFFKLRFDISRQGF